MMMKTSVRRGCILICFLLFVANRCVPHALQGAGKPRGPDIVALTGGREYWPKLRDISCHESRGIRYPIWMNLKGSARAIDVFAETSISTTCEVPA